jgi:putative phosphoribosyl transferase
MPYPGEAIVFENRHDAGRRLAAELGEYQGQSVVVLAIPNGGVPVAVEVAGALDAELSLVISRKIPMPLRPEAGFGAIADSGNIILNDEVVRRLGLSRQQIEYEASKVRAEIKKRSLLYRGEKPPASITGRTAIIVDDGLASGITMLAAVESVRYRRPRATVVAVPCASAMALKQVERVASRVVALTVSYLPTFYVSDFYRHWYDVGDSEVVQYLNQWRVRSHPPK